MRIGLPLWGERLSPLLDTASKLLVVDRDEERERLRFEMAFQVCDLPTRCIRIQGLGLDLLICGAISRAFLDSLRASGVQILPGISGVVEEVLTAYFSGSLAHPRFLMPGVRVESLDPETPGLFKKASREVPTAKP